MMHPAGLAERLERKKMTKIPTLDFKKTKQRLTSVTDASASSFTSQEMMKHEYITHSQSYHLILLPKKSPEPTLLL